MRRSFLSLAALAALTAVAPVLADARGPSTPAERKRAVDVTRKLEQQPLAKDANAERRWLLQWIVEIPDLHVNGCSGPLDALAQDQDGERFGRLLWVQSMFGMAAFQVQHPKEKDWVAIQSAGIESVLRAYRSLLRAEPNARWEELDALLAAAKAGQLEAVVEKTMDGCGDEKGPGPGDAI